MRGRRKGRRGGGEENGEGERGREGGGKKTKYLMIRLIIGLVRLNEELHVILQRGDVTTEKEVV